MDGQEARDQDENRKQFDAADPHEEGQEDLRAGIEVGGGDPGAESHAADGGNDLEDEGEEREGGVAKKPAENGSAGEYGDHPPTGSEPWSATRNGVFKRRQRVVKPCD